MDRVNMNFADFINIIALRIILLPKKAKNIFGVIVQIAPFGKFDLQNSYLKC